MRLRSSITSVSQADESGFAVFGLGLGQRGGRWAALAERRCSDTITPAVRSSGTGTTLATTVAVPRPSRVVARPLS